MKKIEGGCLCGAIRYGGEAEPMATVVCHCTNCQKVSGGSFSLNVLLPKGAVTFEGKLSTYVDTGDSGQPLDRNFCGKCGSAIFNAPSMMQDLIVLKAGTLDDVSWVKPSVEIYCDSAQEWTRLNEKMQAFPGMMPA